MLKILLWFLKQRKLKQENKALIIKFLLESIHAIPIKDIITFQVDGTIKVKDKSLSLEQAVSLRESAIALQQNQFYKLMKEQIAYEAVKMGIHNSINMDGVLFSKSAIWIQQQEFNLIKQLSGQIDQE